MNQRLFHLMILAAALNVFLSCTGKKNISKATPYKQHEVFNGASYEQRGYGLPNDSSIRVFGELHTYNKDAIQNASIHFVNEEKDTIASGKTDNKGKFNITLPTDWFQGELIVQDNLSFFRIPNLSLGQYARDFEFKITMAFKPAIDYEYIKLNKKDIREIKRLQKNNELKNKIRIIALFFCRTMLA
ncbi:hypothetical protein [Sphingobacterium sp. LRF_L2]|uniref:hypothetical protein n=1 Tax=Sphingobacterium sp. LRF_L2 TaxID=3369421 RepID=UPI003F5F945B